MDLLHRIRWANVARAAALVAAVLLVVAWPKLRAEPPPLPPQPAVDEQAPAPGGELGFEGGAESAGSAPVETREGAERRRRAERLSEVVRRERARRRRHAERRRAAGRRAESGRLVEGPRARLVVPPVAAAPAPRIWPAAPTEFGFEGL
jgi:hypothetical protein